MVHALCALVLMACLNLMDMEKRRKKHRQEYCQQHSRRKCPSLVYVTHEMESVLVYRLQRYKKLRVIQKNSFLFFAEAEYLIHNRNIKCRLSRLPQPYELATYNAKNSLKIRSDTSEIQREGKVREVHIIITSLLTNRRLLNYIHLLFIFKRTHLWSVIYTLSYTVSIVRPLSPYSVRFVPIGILTQSQKSSILG